MHTKLPALAHDSLLFKNIGDEPVEKIIKLYTTFEKQIFIAFDKDTAYSDEAKEILNKSTVIRLDENGNESPSLDDKVTDRDTQRMDYKLGEGLLTLMVAGIGFVIVMIICGIIYLVAWSRIIMIFLYVTVAPIPMATVMSDSWVNSIGQNYLKNLMALTIQGFLMLVLMVVYNGLVSRTATLINGGEGGFMGMILIIVSMAIVAKMLIGTHGLAKSITGAS